MPRVASNVWLTLLVMLGLVASLLGAGTYQARGAHGDDPDVDFEAVFSACVGPATDSAGFTDTVGSFAEEAINCLAHYGITAGRTATTYAPGESVLRWQMALFLARAALPAGIVLENPASDQGFTDIGDVSDEAQNAINGLAREGIMPGVSTTAFQPNQAVNRASMAVLLDAFLGKALPGEGAFGPDASRYSEVQSDNNNVFTDLRNVSIAANRAIGRIYELGVTTGIGDHQFGPAGLVTRAQMAAFITRALAHTRARPAGVSVQASEETLKGAASSVELLVSVRDAAFVPLPDVLVDVFRVADDSAGLDSDGSCAADKVTELSGSVKCRIDSNDEATDGSGNITTLVVEGISAATTVWAWMGDVGNEYDSDTAASSATVGFLKSPSQVLISDDLAAKQQVLPFGESVTFRLQVTDEDDVPAAESGWRIPIRVSQTEAGSSNVSASFSTYTTDASGRVELTFTKNGTDAAGDTARVVLQVGASADVADDVATKTGEAGSLPVVDKTTNKVTESGEYAGRYVVNWSEANSEPTTLTLRAVNPFSVASDAGRGASGAVTATLTDQYGSPVRGARISFRSDDQEGIGAADDGLQTVLTDTTRAPRPVFNSDIVMTSSPAEISSDTARVNLTIGFYLNPNVRLHLGSRQAGGHFTIDYAISLPAGVTAAEGDVLTGSVSLPPGPVVDGLRYRPLSATVEHPAVTLSGLEDAVGRNIQIGGKLAVDGFCADVNGVWAPCGHAHPQTSDFFEGWVPVPIHRTVVSIVEDDELTVVSQDGAQRNIPCGSFSELGGSSLLAGDIYPVQCLVGDARGSRRTTNSRGETVFSYNRDSEEGGLETIWASYVRADGETLLTDRLYYPWVEETEGFVSGRILVADAGNDQAVIHPGLGQAPQLVSYDANDQFSSLDGLDVYANFDGHLGRDADAGPPGYLEVRHYSSTARGGSNVSLGGSYTYPTPAAVAQWMDENSDLAASDTGVIVIGNPAERRAYVFDGVGDRTPQTLDNGSDTGEFGYDVAVSADGSTIVISDPQWIETVSVGGGLGAEVYQGRAYVYTKSFAGGNEFALAATLTNGYTGAYSSYFGSGLDISGDGNTIAVASPAAGILAAQCVRITVELPDCLTVVQDFGIGYVQLFEKPGAGWRTAVAATTPQGPTQIPAAALGTSDYTASVGQYRSVSVSYDGSVVAAGDTLRWTSYEDDQGDEIEVEEAGGVLVWERPRSGWLRGYGYNTPKLLTLLGDDLEDWGWIGAGARLSGNGSAVVVSGNHAEAGERKPELYVFSRSGDGWQDGAPYATLTPPDLGEHETFGRSVDINWDGTEVIADRHLLPLADYRGAVQMFTKSGNRWRGNSQLLGPEPGDGFGRYAAYASGDSVVAAHRFGGDVTFITR